MFRTFNIATAVIDEETFAEILHPCLLHSLTHKVRQTGVGNTENQGADLTVECSLGLTRNIFLLVITEYETLNLVAQIQNVQDTLCMLPDTHIPLDVLR
jgi:hypothetical protein